MPDNKIDIIISAKNLASGAFKKVVSSTGKLTRGIRKAGVAAAKVARKLGSLAIKVAALGAAGVVLAGAFVLKKAIGQFADFESALVDMGKVTKESLGAIKKKIMDLPSALGSATELVKGYYQVISAGVTGPKKALETLRIAARSAKAAHVDQSEVIKGLTKVMAGFEGKIKTVSEASDLLFTIEKEGQTSFAELIPIIGGLAKLSSDLGVSQNELGGSLALITQTAGSTSEAATQYQAVLMGLMKPTETMSETLLEMGYESAQAAVAQLGLSETLRQLKESTGGSAEKMNDLFGRVEGVIGVSALAANNFKNLAGKIGAMGEKTGAADKAWQDYQGTLNALWETVKNTIGKQVTLIGEKLAPTIKKVIERTEAWMVKNRALITQEVGEWIEKIVEFLKGLKPAFDSIIKRIGAWYEANKGVMKMKFVEHLKKASTAIIKVSENVNIALIPVKALGKAFQTVGKFIGETAAKIVNFIEKLAKIPKKIAMKFTGKGSTETMLSEKIAEMQGKFGAFSSYVGGLQPQFNIDATGATSALSGVSDAIQSLYAEQIEKVMRATANVGTLAGESGYYSKPFQQMASNKLRGEEAGLKYLQELMGSAAAGTGSAAGATNFGDIIINIPEGENSQSAQDWRDIVRNYIVPELEAVGYG